MPIFKKILIFRPPEIFENEKFAAPVPAGTENLDLDIENYT